MCYFISVGLPRKFHTKWLGLLPEDLQSLPSRYGELESKIKDLPVTTIVRGMCSCDLWNREGSLNSQKRYERKGWSASKVARALENRQKSDFHPNLHPEFRRWLADAAQDAGKAYLFVHWDSQTIDLRQTVSITVERFRDQSTSIPDEQLIEIKP